MKTFFTTILALLQISMVCIAQDTLYLYKAGTVAEIRALADIDSITFYNSGTMVTDIEGNFYKTVKIGNQTWMAENLKTRQFNDGMDIPLVEDFEAWEALDTPGYCWYNNDSATYNATYGVLYNWYTVYTGKLCPTGWHVPTDAEWTVLKDYLGGEGVAGGKLKEAGFTHWISPNTNATNETSFTALPGGHRTSSYQGDDSLASFGGWWTATKGSQEDLALRCKIHSDAEIAYRLVAGLNAGLSVRCVKD